MIKAFYTARSGAISSQANLDVVSNNISNMQTNGYKSQKGEFQDLLYQNMSQDDGSLMIGSGSKLDSVKNDFAVGALVATGNGFDSAIIGDGFFGVQVEDETYYTRNGNFHIGVIDDEMYLMSDNGYVLDEDEEPIVIDTDDPNYNIGVFDFNNKGDLELVGNSFFKISNEDAEYEIVEDPEIKYGYLEESNVDLATEMTNIIKNQRAFQFNTKIIQVADEIEQTVNSLSS